MKLIGITTGLDRCPHCAIACPRLEIVWHGRTGGSTMCYWIAAMCVSCGCIIVASGPPGSENLNAEMSYLLPKNDSLDQAIPDPAARYLRQAIDTLHAPDASVMTSCSAVDAMLKEKNYTKGTVNERIKKAVDDHLITPEMGEWAHQVRIDSNDPRHADEKRPHATPEQAKQSVEFVKALAQFMFVLPTRVKKGIGESTLTAA